MLVDGKINVVGGGGWGTALSEILAMNCKEVLIWTYEKEVAEEINIYHTNSTFLPGVSLSERITATNDINELADSNVLVFAVPTQFIRNVLKSVSFSLSDKIIVNVAKGIETGTLFRISEIFQDCSFVNSENYLILTGPSHAEEVACQIPTAVVVASKNTEYQKLVQEIFTTEFFRVYSSDDVIGCEIGGALKNVIAIAAGIIDGLGFGDNTKAALVTRGLAEISRLGTVLGANPLTFSGLSGLGDLFVTCSSPYSRNRKVGELIGRGQKLIDIVQQSKMIAEGVETTKSAYKLGLLHNVELPITEQVYKILFEDKMPREAIKELMLRKSKKEWW